MWPPFCCLWSMHRHCDENQDTSYKRVCGRMKWVTYSSRANLFKESAGARTDVHSSSTTLKSATMLAACV